MKIPIIISFFYFLTLVSSHGYYCPHDKLDLKVSYDRSVKKSHGYSSYTSKSFTRKLLSESTYEPIRIHVDYSYLSKNIKPSLRKYVQNELIPAAVNYYTETLKVIPLRNTLKASFATICNLDTPAIFQNEGVETDLAILVSSDYEETNFVAYARACVLSYINNRPNFGNMHLNLKYIKYGDEVQHQQNLLVVLHEMAHIFGISQGLYEYYINPDTADELTGHVKQTKINGVSAYVVDVEPLTTRLREYFNCPSIEGAILENEGPEQSAASHFERRIFFDEIMTASTIDNARISEFTLAFLEGTGWYQGNYNMTEFLYWGKGKGCEFYTGPCMNPETKKPLFKEFCSALTDVGCSADRKSGAYCGSSRISTNTSLPSSFNYWGNFTAVSDKFVDNCPYYDANDLKECEDPSQQSKAQIVDEVFGSQSRCFTGNIFRSKEHPQKTNYCIKTACVQNPDYSFEMTLTFGSNVVTCKEEGKVSVPGYSGHLDCPDPNEYCSTYGKDYCPRGCMGRGECVDNKCQCAEGWGGADCSTKVFVDHCEKCESNPLMQACYGDGCQCLSTDIACLCSVGFYECDENGNIIEEVEESVTEIEDGQNPDGSSSGGDENSEEGSEDQTSGGDDSGLDPTRTETSFAENPSRIIHTVLCALIVVVLGVC